MKVSKELKTKNPSLLNLETNASYKTVLPHGQFESWVKQEFKWSKMTASKYIKVAKEIEPKVKDSLLLPNSLEGLYQLASGLSKADEETKEEILTAVEEKTKIY